MIFCKLILMQSFIQCTVFPVSTSKAKLIGDCSISRQNPANCSLRFLFVLFSFAAIQREILHGEMVRKMEIGRKTEMEMEMDRGDCGERWRRR
jgi:hypothetical protein